MNSEPIEYAVSGARVTAAYQHRIRSRNDRHRMTHPRRQQSQSLLSVEVSVMSRGLKAREELIAEVARQLLRKNRIEGLVHLAVSIRLQSDPRCVFPLQSYKYQSLN
jgi:hypothetical protein